MSILIWLEDARPLPTDIRPHAIADAAICFDPSDYSPRGSRPAEESASRTDMDEYIPHPRMLSLRYFLRFPSQWLPPQSVSTYMVPQICSMVKHSKTEFAVGSWLTETA